MTTATEQEARLPPGVEEYFGIEADEALEGAFTRDEVGRIVKAMSMSVRLVDARNGLREKKVHHSASSWKMLLQERVRPAIDAGDLSVADLLGLLQDLEEFAPSHTLFFRVDPPSLPELQRQARRNPDLLNAPPLLDAGPKFTLCHMRFDDDVFVVKGVESKTRTEKVREYLVGTSLKVSLTRQVTSRRVKLARLHPQGILEIRLGAISAPPGGNNYDRYADEALSFARSLRHILPTVLGPADLAPFKRMLWDGRRIRPGRKPKILILSQAMKTNEGGELEVNSGRDGKSAVTDEELVLASRSIIENSKKGGALANAKVHWVARKPPGLPGKPLTLFMTRVENEFYTNSHFAKSDYEKVVDDILSKL